MQSFGYLKYDPTTPNSKNEKWWAMLKCDENLTAYYRYWLSKCWIVKGSGRIWSREQEIQTDDDWEIFNRGVKLHRSVWGSHISVVRGEEPHPKDAKYWKKYENRKIWFEYDPEFLNSNGRHWWVRIISPELEDIRSELGLSRIPQIFDDRKNKFVNSPFHITIGYAQ